MGFELNPYDPCVANCMIKGKQCTIGWYVDDTKISHANSTVVTAIIKKLKSKFGKMLVVQGDKYVFLGMKVRYNRKDKNTTINMKSYLIKAIDESELNINRSAATPAGKEMFDIDEKAEKVSPSAAAIFHRVTAKLLYVSFRARMDLLLATRFLPTRVSKSTHQDLAKRKRLLEYISGSLDDEYVIGTDDLGRLRTWVDASYAVHPDCKSHTPCRSELARWFASPANKSSTPRAPPKLNSLAPAITFPTPSG